MKSTQALLTVATLFLPITAHAQLPANFAWINVESDQKVMPLVRRALHDPTITAIREVGVEDGYALVMTASRGADEPTPDYDSWKIYNIALSSGKSRILAFGYGVKLLDWIPPGGAELAITYYDCWGCEADTLFTTFHFVHGVGWRARWPNKSRDPANPQPGAVLLYAEDPGEDDVDQQVSAIVKQPNGGFAAGNWYRSRNDDTGKWEDDVERYSIDRATGAERVEKLTGSAAEAWRRAICTQSNILIEPSSGQDSKACRALLKTPPARSIPQK